MRRMATELIDDSITDLWDSPHLVYAEYERQYAEFRGEAVQEGKAHKGRGGPIMLTLLLWDAGVSAVPQVVQRGRRVVGNAVLR